jgi:MFS transporter, SP family, solute carrier family 2 (myo-inositol transporter), member 13
MASSLEAPLIANSEDDHDEELQQYDADAELDSDGGSGASKHLGDRPGLFVWLLTFAAGISGLLFGCGCQLFPSYFDCADRDHSQTIPA